MAIGGEDYFKAKDQDREAQIVLLATILEAGPDEAQSETVAQIRTESALGAVEQALREAVGYES